jgi:hypothetical protein
MEVAIFKTLCIAEDTQRYNTENLARTAANSTKIIITTTTAYIL